MPPLAALALAAGLGAAGVAAAVGDGSRLGSALGKGVANGGVEGVAFGSLSGDFLERLTILKRRPRTTSTRSAVY